MRNSQYFAHHILNKIEVFSCFLSFQHFNAYPHKFNDYTHNFNESKKSPSTESRKTLERWALFIAIFDFYVCKVQKYP